jgi:folate-binding protein YgfZ
MTQSWSSLIAEHLANQELTDWLSLQKADSALGLCSDTGSALIAIEGPDTEKFLQGQLTADVSQITNERFSFGAHCNPKGRAIYSFLASKIGATTLLRTRTDGQSIALETLGKYIVFSKAEARAAHDMVILGFIGNQVKTQLLSFFDASIEASSASTPVPGGVIHWLSASTAECWLEQDAAEQLLAKAIQSCLPISQQAWHAQQIALGLAQVSATSSAEHLPPNLNFNELEAISYTKGCYTGQEVIARMYYLGNQKRHTYLGRVAASHDEIPELAKVVTVDENGTAANASAGIIVNSAEIAPNQSIVLACLAEKHIDDSLAVESGQTSYALALEPLPYPFIERQTSSR